MVQLALFETTLCNFKFTQSEYDGQMVVEFFDHSYVCYLFLFFRKSSVNHELSHDAARLHFTMREVLSTLAMCGFVFDLWRSPHVSCVDFMVLPVLEKCSIMYSC